MSQVRVLVVDASLLDRQLLVRGLEQDPGLAVVGTAGDAYEARDKIVQLAPDVMTLAPDLPRMDGIAFLKRLMPQYPMPVVVVAPPPKRGQPPFEALEAGAVDLVTKPSCLRGEVFEGMLVKLRQKVRRASTMHFARPTTAGTAPAHAPGALRNEGTMMAIGASTGGVEALRTVLTMLPADVPGIVVVQHMPDSFVAPFAQRLDQLCRFGVSQARHGDLVRAGHCLIAPGDFQLRIQRKGSAFEVALSTGPKVDGHKPSVTVMMESVARTVGRDAAGAILTGMGRDGATGLLAMRRAGGHTVVQDEATCVVYGMPKAAWEIGATRYQLPLTHIANSLLTPFRR